MSTTAAPESQPHPLDLYTAEQSSARSSHDSPTRSAQSSPEKKSRSSFVRERGEKDKKSPRSPRGSSSFAFRKKDSDDSHPLNLPPEELRRLSALRTATMGSPREEAGEPMQESTRPVPLLRHTGLPPAHLPSKARPPRARQWMLRRAKKPETSFSRPSSMTRRSKSTPRVRLSEASPAHATTSS